MRREQTVNLVREQNDETYVPVSDYDMMMMKARDEVVFEKSRVDGKRVGFFYIKK